MRLLIKEHRIGCLYCLFLTIQTLHLLTYHPNHHRIAFKAFPFFLLVNIRLFMINLIKFYFLSMFIAYTFGCMKFQSISPEHGGWLFYFEINIFLIVNLFGFLYDIVISLFSFFQVIYRYIMFIWIYFSIKNQKIICISSVSRYFTHVLILGSYLLIIYKIFKFLYFLKYIR